MLAWINDTLRSDTSKQVDGGISQGAQADQMIALEKLTETIVKREKEVEDRERRMDEEQRKMTRRGQHVKEQERRMAEQDQNLEDSQRELEKIRWERSVARKEAKEAVDRLGFFKDKIGKLEKESKESEKQLRQSHQHATALEERLNRREKDIKDVRNKLTRMETELGQTHTLLEARTSELKGAQSFLTTADSLSGGEVSSMVEGLNAEILQAAAFMVDSFTFERVNATPGEALTTARTRTESFLGPTVLRLLSSVRHCEDPLVVQMALQACMTHFGTWATATWDLGVSRDPGLLGKIYSQMWKAEDQAIFARWRALTRIYTRKALHSQLSLSASLQPSMIEILSSVLVTAGCTADPPTIQEVLRSRFCDRMSTLIDLTIRLRQALGEEVTSGDLEVIYIPFDHAFDSGTMEDISGQNMTRRTKQNDRVLCTTELGLQRTVRTGMKDYDRSCQTTNLLKSKVALVSVTEGMATYDF